FPGQAYQRELAGGERWIADGTVLRQRAGTQRSGCRADELADPVRRARQRADGSLEHTRHLCEWRLRTRYHEAELRSRLRWPDVLGLLLDSCDARIAECRVRQRDS